MGTSGHLNGVRSVRDAVVFARGALRGRIGRPAKYHWLVDDLAKRLEMLLVLQWLDEGRSPAGAVRLSVVTAAGELDAGAGRAGVLAVMSALSQLEEHRLVGVELTAAGPREPLVTLAESLRRDADSLFGAGGSVAP
jgi:hypothetical protein